MSADVLCLHRKPTSARSAWTRRRACGSGSPPGPARFPTRTWPPPARWCWRPSARGAGPGVGRPRRPRGAGPVHRRRGGPGRGRVHRPARGRGGQRARGQRAGGGGVRAAGHREPAARAGPRGPGDPRRPVRGGARAADPGRGAQPALRHGGRGRAWGQIGLAAARLFRAAGAQVSYSDPAPRDPDAAAALGLARLELGELLARSDVVTLHVPLVAATRGLIGEAGLRRMRPGAILVNASRGGVVDEAASLPRWRTAGWAAFVRRILSGRQRLTCQGGQEAISMVARGGADGQGCSSDHGEPAGPPPVPGKGAPVPGRPARMLRDSWFETSTRQVGLEVEVNLVNDSGTASMRSPDVLDAIGDPSWAP